MNGPFMGERGSFANKKGMGKPILRCKGVAQVCYVLGEERGRKKLDMCPQAEVSFLKVQILKLISLSSSYLVLFLLPLRLWSHIFLRGCRRWSEGPSSCNCFRLKKDVDPV